jgi:uncharacterized phage-like protein YoqJ
MKIAITGHRPNKLGNDYNLISPLIIAIKEEIKSIVEIYAVECMEKNEELRLITGMALGIDTLFARIAVELHIPFIAAVPFRGQENRWVQSSIDEYYSLLKLASKIVCTDTGKVFEDINVGKFLSEPRTEFSGHKMQKRNEWMVNNCDRLIAVWDGTGGGTANCIRYAESIGKEIVRINPLEIAA